MGRRTLTVEAINARLDAAQLGLKIYQRGDKLSIRGTLPPKPSSKRIKSQQQLISLGVYANPAGLEYAESEAFRLGGLLAQKRFSWEEFSLETPDQAKDTDLICRVWIERFRLEWLKHQDSDDAATDLKWREQFWYPAFKWLSPDAALTPHLLESVVQRWKPNSRSRQIACQKLQRLADFANIKSDIKAQQGDYSLSNVERIIPEDADIIAAIDQMKNKSWQWVAGMMATYNLRDHEAFLCEVEWRDYDAENMTMKNGWWPWCLMPLRQADGKRFHCLLNGLSAGNWGICVGPK